MFYKPKRLKKTQNPWNAVKLLAAVLAVLMVIAFSIKMATNNTVASNDKETVIIIIETKNNGTEEVLIENEPKVLIENEPEAPIEEEQVQEEPIVEEEPEPKEPEAETETNQDRDTTTASPLVIGPKSTKEGEEKSILSQREREVLAKLLYGEANHGDLSDCERSMVIWVVFNRFDSNISWFGNTIEEIVTRSGQFVGYRENNPVTRENLNLVDDVARRWTREKATRCSDEGRTIPKDFLFFVTDENTPGFHNAFYKWASGGLGKDGDGKIWYSYLNPIANPYG